MTYKVTNLTYSPLRLTVKGNQIIVPGRNADIENFIIVDELDDSLKTLSQRGLLKIKPLN